MRSHQRRAERDNHLPRPAAMQGLTHPRTWLDPLAAKAHCWLMVNLPPTRTPRSLSGELLSSRSFPSVYVYPGFPCLRCKVRPLPLLNFIRLVIAQLSSLWEERQCFVSFIPHYPKPQTWPDPFLPLQLLRPGFSAGHTPLSHAHICVH